jgi:hypothetical protein
LEDRSTPDIAGAQPVPQRGEYSGFVEPSVRLALLGNQPFPVLSQRHRRVGGDGALAGAIEIPQQANCREGRIVRARRLELQRLDQFGREFAQRQVAVRGTLQRIFAAEIGEFPRLALNAKQLGPANGFIDDGEGIPLAVPGRAERFDRVIEQAHQAADISGPGDIAPLVGLSGARKQAADQLVRHIEHSVGEPGFKIEDGGDDWRPARGRRADP